MSQDPIITKGVPVGSGDNGPVPIRREIRDLEQNYPDLWNLYLLGLDAFQKVDENDPLSYYQIAGIHGRPYKAWPHAAGNAKPAEASGYCTHNSILFPPWHRPYLVQFEEILYALVQNIAGTFPDPNHKARYVAAARDFRMPYWDWAMALQAGDGVLPASVQSDTVRVISPTSDGQPVDMKNPLYSFDFHPLNPSPGDFPLKNTGRGPLSNNIFATWPSSVRYPLNDTAVSQNDQVEAALEQQARNLRELVFYLVSSYQRYGPFSNNQWNRGNPGTYGSLEGVHDTVHGVTGGGGHMSVIPYAAFDPLFWLHHCNVDRLFALWQALHPSSYVTSQPTESGTFTTKAGSIETETSPLTPFYNAPGSFWTSDGVRSTATFGYAYPETQSWNFKTTGEYQSSVTTAVKELYGSSSLANMARGSPEGVSAMAQVKAPVSVRGLGQGLPQVKMAVKAPAETAKTATDDTNSSNGNTVANPFIATPTIRNGNIGVQAPIAEETANGDGQAGKQIANIEKASNGQTTTTEKETGGKSNTLAQQTPAKPTLHSLAPNGKYLEWLTNIRAQKHSLGGTFHVHIFLGAFDVGHPATYPTAPNLVGTFTVLGDSPDTGCTKCARDREAHLSVTGQIPLTVALVERVIRGELAGLGVESVVGYLKGNLHWRVVMMDGTEVPRGQVGDLKVSVISNEATVPEAEDQLPVYAEQVQVHPEATTAADGTGRGEGTGLVDWGEA